MRSSTRQAAMSAAGKKDTLAMTDPAKPWPLRPATRAGQDVIAFQVIADTIHQRASPPPPRVPAERSCMRPDSSSGTGSPLESSHRCPTRHREFLRLCTSDAAGPRRTRVFGPDIRRAWLPGHRERRFFVAPALSFRASAEPPAAIGSIPALPAWCLLWPCARGRARRTRALEHRRHRLVDRVRHHRQPHDRWTGRLLPARRRQGTGPSWAR